MRQRVCVLLFLMHLFIYARAQENEADTSIGCEKACFECCRPDAYAPAGVMTDHIHPKGEFSIAYSVMYMHMQDNMQGTTLVSNESLFANYMMVPRAMDMQMHMLMPMYGITNRLTVMSMVAFLKNAMSMSMQPAENMSGMPGMTNTNMPATVSSSGPGDTKVYALYNLLGNCMHRLVASAGISFPTGNSAVKGPTLQDPRDVLPYNMQLSTGTYDLLPGLVYVGQTDRLSFGAAVNVSLRMGYNSRGYSLGNEYAIGPWLAYKFFRWGSLSLRGEGYDQEGIKGYDPQINQSSLNDPSADARNSGRRKVSVLAGFNFYLTGKHLNDTRVLLECGMPLWQTVNGIQMASKAVINLRIQYSFKKN